MKFKRFYFFISIVCIALIFTGCGEPLYAMTEEEEAIIAAYASKTVSKFNQNQTIGIANARVRTGELEEDYTPGVPEEEATEEPVEDTEQEVKLDPETGEPIEGEEAEEGAEDSSLDEGGYSFTSAVDIPGVEFTCSEFDVSPEYKTKSFLLEKVSGKKYIVLSISAENTSNSSVDFSKYSDRSYSLSLNGGEKTNNLFTPLGNDLANFDGLLAAGDTKSFVLVFLYSDSSVENITSLELFVTSEGTTRGTTI
ncbi:hypothetical protein SAMN04487830_11725 [Pseudobutyrivibrio sp. OR37]|uniref:hypothetical protein n=1 Tax=Pseudobutyrivibrio sp. OR37 TaxID=1798186 RepID=UPI0008E00138|nr:hypothetical protein [Pseudobutyrivibrio sp. OR37]SFI00266.1 hypothetical protein SAMN04487830_11725 [Pseudobutyrivibrio sp. OR37]